MHFVAAVKALIEKAVEAAKKEAAKKEAAVLTPPKSITSEAIKMVSRVICSNLYSSIVCLFSKFSSVIYAVLY